MKVISLLAPARASLNLSVRALPTSAQHPFAIEGLSYKYKSLQIFAEFSMTSNSRLIVLRGASGCGKTTLLKLLSGNLAADRVQKMPESKGSCLVLQEDSLLPWLTGIENITKFTGTSADTMRSHPMFVLVHKFVEHKAFRMSYGQRRLVELFRAILFQPPYLYLDEPFNFLDEDNMGSVVPFLQREFLQNTTVVLTNHHQDDMEILRNADLFKFDGTFPVVTLKCISRHS